ncbi:MAG: cation-transporting P-type ATPase [Gammaproteobacteria bacterium]
MTDARSPMWHAQEAAAVLNAVESSAAGLTADEARRRFARYGPNTLPRAAAPSAWRRFLRQFHNVLIYVLLIAAAITAVLGHPVDSAVIFGVVFINAIVGFLQEGKAEQALAAIRQMLSLEAQALRAGRRVSIPAEELVPGDIVYLAAGDKVPADLRLIHVRNLRVDEAALTGESLAVEKSPAPVAADAPLGDRCSMAYAGTLVAYGQGTGVVIGTGSDTEIGRINAMLADVTELTTPLLRQLAGFGLWLTWVILGFAAATFAFGTLIRDYSAADMFMAAVGLAVAAIPEGLPAILTITLAIGVQRMAARRAIVRRLPAVETIGSVTVICTDKTGTLTRNEMTVRTAITADASYTVSGVGYAPIGGFSLDDRAVDAADDPALIEAARAALLCNDAALQQQAGAWTLSGDPTEGALISFALKAGLDEALEREVRPRTDVIPFESEHRFMATLHHDHAGAGYVYVKGAPERVLALCARERRASGTDAALVAERWQARMQAAAASGMRLLAVAVRPAARDETALVFAAVERGGFTLLAVLGLADPPRTEAIAAVAACRTAGIAVKMITGDHAATARAIGEQLKLADRIDTLTGAELDALDDAALARAAAAAHVFARTSPAHKLRLVQALQANGDVVAMTGDGVNDAPALKRADIGIAMGNKGTEAAKEAAEIVLADDNFASIAAAVEEGRTVYGNLRRAIVFILPTNGGEAGMLVLAILLGLTLPITPVQILWVNMITTVTLSLAIAFEAAEPDVMRRAPRDPRASLLTPFLVWRILFVTLLLVAGGFGLYLWEIEHGADIATARTVAVNTLVVGEAAYLFNVRRLTASVLDRDGLFGNRYALIAIGLLLVFQLLFTYAPPMQRLFGTADLDVLAWARVAAVGIAVFLCVELEKWLGARWRLSGAFRREAVT